jgi:hypothetical protein
MTFILSNSEDGYFCLWWKLITKPRGLNVLSVRHHNDKANGKGIHVYQKKYIIWMKKDYGELITLYPIFSRKIDEISNFTEKEYTFTHLSISDNMLSSAPKEIT